MTDNDFDSVRKAVCELWPRFATRWHPAQQRAVRDMLGGTPVEFAISGIDEYAREEPDETKPNWKRIRQLATRSYPNTKPGWQPTTCKHTFGHGETENGLILGPCVKCCIDPPEGWRDKPIDDRCYESDYFRRLEHDGRKWEPLFKATQEEVPF